MKRIQIVLAMLVLSASFVVAQPETNKQGKHPHFKNKEMSMDKLNLTDEQKTKMKSVNDDFRKQMQMLKDNGNQTVQQQKNAREALRKSHQAQVDNILTTEQKNQLAQMKREGKMQRGQMNNKHLDKMKQELNLTEQQVSQLQSSQQATNAKMEAINNNSSLDATAKRQQLHALREEMKNNIQQVLTPEQKEKWQGMKKDKSHAPHTKRGDYKAPTS